MTVPDLCLFVFSLLGLWLVPASLGRAVWAVPAGFAAVAFFVLFAPAPLHPHLNPWVLLLLSQAPWVLLSADLVARGKIAAVLRYVPARALVAFSLFRFMGVGYVFSAIWGGLSPEFAVQAAAGEVFAALGAALLWLTWPRVEAGGWFLWHRGLLIFWNTYALVTSLGLTWRILRADPGLPLGIWARPSRELHAFFTTWPHSLEFFFWIPLAIGIHAAILFKLFLYPAKREPLAGVPGDDRP